MDDNSEAFLDDCALLHFFDMRAFDALIAQDHKHIDRWDIERAVLLRERADALAAWRSNHQEWLSARLDALLRAANLITSYSSGLKTIKKHRDRANKKELQLKSRSPRAK